MRVTFIIKNLTDSAHADLAAMSDADRYAKLHKWAFGDLKHCVSEKIGTSDAFRDKVALNALFRGRVPTFSYKLEARKGYKLATFEVA